MIRSFQIAITTYRLWYALCVVYLLTYLLICSSARFFPFICKFLGVWV